jgi:hypothetical protein
MAVLRSLIVAALTAGLLTGQHVAMAAPGQLIWRDTYNAPGEDVDYAVDVARSPDGSIVFSTGWATTAEGTNFLTVAFDADTGTRLWARQYDDPAHRFDRASDLAVAPDGSTVYVTGYTESKRGTPNTTVVGYDALTGKRAWASQIDVAGHGGVDYGNVLVAVADMVVTVGNSRDKITTVGFDAATGEVGWVKRSTLEGDGRAIETDGSSVFAGGYVMDTNPFELNGWVSAYSIGDGHLRWVRRYRPLAGATVDALAVTKDGSRLYASGVSGRRVAIQALATSSGSRAWTRRTTPDGYFDDQSTLATAPDGSVFVSFDRILGNDESMITFGLDPAGDELWAEPAVENVADAFDTPEDIVVSPDGKTLFVVGIGAVFASETRGALVLAYAAASGGDPLWHHIETGKNPGNFEAAAVDVSPDGSRIYVAGLRARTYVTEAYATS